jgi:hypothetical protein
MVQSRRLSTNDRSAKIHKDICCPSNAVSILTVQLEDDELGVHGRLESFECDGLRFEASRPISSQTHRFPSFLHEMRARLDSKLVLALDWLAVEGMRRQGEGRVEPVETVST